MLLFLLVVIAIVALELAWAKRHDWTSRRRLGAAAIAALVLALALVTIPNMLYLQKVVGRLAMPVGLVWILLGANLFLAWHRRRLAATAIAAVIFVSYTLAGNPVLGGAMLHWLEADYREVQAFSGPPLDAVFLLGGGTARGRSSPARLADSGDRVLTAARVYKEREVGHVVASGSTIHGIGVQRDLAEEGAEILGDLGVPPEAIVRLPEPKNSSQEVAAYRALAEERGWEKVGIVTSAWHLRRVMRLCRRSGLDAEPLPADFRGERSWDGFLSVMPDGGGFRNVQIAAWEILGAAVGR